MRFVALATDYDNTMAEDGVVPADTIEALKRLHRSGRKIVLVTGRDLDDMRAIFDPIELFDWVVAENGALLFDPASKKECLLAESPPVELLEELRRRGVPHEAGRSIIASREPYQGEILDAIEKLGLEWHVIFNKGAVMVLPSSTTKATGLKAALRELNLSPHNVVGIGDAENDHAFLGLCECSVAVANALPALRDRCDLITTASFGEGVTELIDMVLDDDLETAMSRVDGHRVLIGTSASDDAEYLPAIGVNLLVAGTSGSGKSTTTTGLLERLSEEGYQVCLIDPEGDYEEFSRVTSLGGPERRATVEEVEELLRLPDQSVAVNLLAIPLDDRPGFFQELWPRLEEMRARTGRPHWIAVDEAHHLLPSEGAPIAHMPETIRNMLLVTVHPEHVAGDLLREIDVVVAQGKDPLSILRAYAEATDHQPPSPDPGDNAAKTDDEGLNGLLWRLHDDGQPIAVRIAGPAETLKRHQRKYAAGELAPEKSFYFRGPRDSLNIRAQNLNLFLQIGEGIDDETWLFHLGRGDYSRWFREMIGDEDLASETEQVEKTGQKDAAASRKAIRRAIRERYTAPE